MYEYARSTSVFFAKLLQQTRATPKDVKRATVLPMALHREGCGLEKYCIWVRDALCLFLSVTTIPHPYKRRYSCPADLLVPFAALLGWRDSPASDP